MNKNAKIYVAGHMGLVGSAIYRELKAQGYTNVLTFEHHEFDLADTNQTRKLFDKYKPEYVFLAAAFAGGIKRAIDSPSQMLVENMLIEANVIKRAYLSKVKKLIFVASSCIYPVKGTQPYVEAQIGTGKTDENWGYAIAKIAGIELCHAYHRQYGKEFMSVVPCNMYGPNDDFQGKHNHVIPALIGKCVAADEKDTIELLGDGKATREFMYSEDFAEACVMIMESVNYDDIQGVVNVGTGYQVRIDSLFNLIKRLVGKPGLKCNWTGNIAGVPAKLMSSQRLSEVLNWQPKTSLQEGIKRSYDWYCTHCKSGEGG